LFASSWLINNKKIKPINYYCTQNTDSNRNNYKFTITKSYQNDITESINTVINLTDLMKKNNISLYNINNN